MKGVISKSEMYLEIIYPKTPEMSGSIKYVTFIPEKATVGMELLKKKLLEEYV